MAVDSPGAVTGNFELTISMPGLPYVPLGQPCPVYDSGTASGGLAGTFDGNDLRTIGVTGPIATDQGVGGGTCMGSEAIAATMTVTAVNPVAPGNLRVSAAGVSPNGGVVNYINNTLNNTNTVSTLMDTGGNVDIFANGGAGGAGSPLDRRPGGGNRVPRTGRLCWHGHAPGLLPTDSVCGC